MIIILSFVAGCQPKQLDEKDQAFLQLFPDVEFNERIKLVDIIQDPVEYGRLNYRLRYENISKDKILINIQDYEGKLYFYSNSINGWKEVDNEIYVIGKDGILSPKKTDPLDFEIYTSNLTIQIEISKLEGANFFGQLLLGPF